MYPSYNDIYESIPKEYIPLETDGPYTYGYKILIKLSYRTWLRIEWMFAFKEIK